MIFLPQVNGVGLQKELPVDVALEVFRCPVQLVLVEVFRQVTFGLDIQGLMMTRRVFVTSLSQGALVQNRKERIPTGWAGRRIALRLDEIDLAGSRPCAVYVVPRH